MAELAIKNVVKYYGNVLAVGGVSFTVHSGELLVRLDAVQAQASLQVITKQLDELRARIARLTAERDGVDEITMPAELADRTGEDTVKTLLASEMTLIYRAQ